jgi:3-dehydroquinate synthase
VSNTTQTVRVELGPRSYDIQLGRGNLAEVGRFLKDRGKVTHALVITDENVHELHAIPAAESLVAAGLDIALVAVPPGEASKSIEVAAGLWNGLLELGADRRSVVVAVGGGVVGDLAGFIAATYARGIRFLQVPTTLLAQVDSSVGGKVGIDLPAAKNMVGAFLQPLGVLIDTATLDTLPPREFVAGLGEVAKYGLSLDAEFFAYLQSHTAAILARDHQVLAEVIARCCRLKADVVQEDEREETGRRAVLNYGHTFGHAVETLTGYDQLLHGEAVAIGMMCAARLAEELGRVPSEFVVGQQKLLEAFGLPVRLPKLDRGKILKTMMHDKKVKHGRLQLVLPDRLGHVELVADVEESQIHAALHE